MWCRLSRLILANFSHHLSEVVSIKKVMSTLDCYLAIPKSVWAVCPHLCHPERVYSVQSGRYVRYLEKEKSNYRFGSYNALKKREMDIVVNGRNISRFLSALEKCLTNLVV